MKPAKLVKTIFMRLGLYSVLLLYDKVINLESVQNANDQARCAAVSIAGGSQIYESLPWFWSDQYDAKIQMVGLNHESAEIMLGQSEYVRQKWTALFT